MMAVVRCEQWLMPARMAGRDGVAPCRKNSSTITTVVAVFSHCAGTPEAGKKLARATVAISIRVKLSGRKRGRDMDRR